MNDIKLDKVGIPLSTGKIQQNNPAVPVANVKQEGVTVTNQMSKLVNLLSSDEQIPNEDARVVEMKQRVQSGDYKVNVHALSDALIANGVLRSIGN